MAAIARQIDTTGLVTMMHTSGGLIRVRPGAQCGVLDLGDHGWSLWVSGLELLEQAGVLHRRWRPDGGYEFRPTARAVASLQDH